MVRFRIQTVQKVQKLSRHHVWVLYSPAVCRSDSSNHRVVRNDRRQAATDGTQGRRGQDTRGNVHPETDITSNASTRPWIYRFVRLVYLATVFQSKSCLLLAVDEWHITRPSVTRRGLGRRMSLLTLAPDQKCIASHASAFLIQRRISSAAERRQHRSRTNVIRMLGVYAFLRLLLLSPCKTT